MLIGPTARQYSDMPPRRRRHRRRRRIRFMSPFWGDTGLALLLAILHMCVGKQNCRGSFCTGYFLYGFSLFIVHVFCCKCEVFIFLATCVFFTNLETFS